MKLIKYLTRNVFSFALHQRKIEIYLLAIFPLAVLEIYLNLRPDLINPRAHHPFILRLMIRIKLLFCLLLIAAEGFGWGSTGHRAVGQIAEENLSKKARKKVLSLLEGNSLAEVSNWMDNIKSDDAYDHTHDWHWVTIPDNTAYAATTLNPDGDLIGKIKEINAALKSGNLDRKTEVEYLKYLIHLVGDIHQPLHVGYGDDAGGNKISVKWFGKPTNLHKVWDSEMIDSKKLSFTELVRFIDKTDKHTIAEWQQTTVEDWADESIALRPQVYALPDEYNLRYEYLYLNFETVEHRISQAGIRLAGLLNDIYG